MAKLAIYRGETLEREVELGPRNARIGRGDQNDIVLPDPAKSVSRFHAELRYEDGRYTLADLNSQNGTWVAGKRVPQVVLEPNVPVIVGTYRLVFLSDDPETVDAEKTLVSAPPPRAAAPAAAATGKPEEPKAAAPPAPPAAPKMELPKPAAATPEPRRAPAQAAEAPRPQPARPDPPKAAPPAPQSAAPAAPQPAVKTPPAAPAPTPKPAAAPAKPAAPAPAAPPKAAPPAPAVKPPEPPKPPAPSPSTPRKGVSKGLLFGGFAVLVVGAVAAGIFLWPAASPTPAAATPEAAAADRAASLAPAQETPSAAQASPLPAEPPQPAPSRTAPRAARTSAPAAEGALSSRANTAASRPAAVPARPREATPAPPAEGAAAPRKPEARVARRGTEPAAAPVRPRDLGTMLAQARSAMIKGDYVTAVSGLEAILKVDPKYQDASQMLEMAKAGAKNAAQLAVDTGAKSEMAGDYDAAAKQYEHALQLDPGSAAAGDAIKRLRGRMQSDGENAFKRGKQFDALGRTSDAVSMYEKAIKLLPPDHASAKAAKERLEALRGGN